MAPELLEILAQGREALGVELVDATRAFGAVDHQVGVLEKL